jgi:hypothetical protein
VVREERYREPTPYPDSKEIIGNEKKFIYYQEDDMWIGWLEQFPDYRTQGETLEELEENLEETYEELPSGKLPHVHHGGELVVG